MGPPAGVRSKVSSVGAQRRLGLRKCPGDRPMAVFPVRAEIACSCFGSVRSWASSDGWCWAFTTEVWMIREPVAAANPRSHRCRQPRDVHGPARVQPRLHDRSAPGQRGRRRGRASQDLYPTGIGLASSLYFSAIRFAAAIGRPRAGHLRRLELGQEVSGHGAGVAGRLADSRFLDLIMIIQESTGSQRSRT